MAIPLDYDTVSGVVNLLNNVSTGLKEGHLVLGFEEAPDAPVVKQALVETCTLLLERIEAATLQRFDELLSQAERAKQINPDNVVIFPGVTPEA
tara:strand:- start:1631 stop:1912 length:282 start_codon:yes stop_codon:yes gene_type:complete